MAKTLITYKCGHTAVVQLYGKSADRERKIAWYATIDCPDCQAAAALDAAPDLPALDGSDKQIRWALTVRVEQLDRLSVWIDSNVAPQDAGLADRITAAARSRIRASWWIDHRDDSPLNLARTIIAEDNIQPTPPTEQATDSAATVTAPASLADAKTPEEVDAWYEANHVEMSPEDWEKYQAETRAICMEKLNAWYDAVMSGTT